MEKDRVNAIRMIRGSTFGWLFIFLYLLSGCYEDTEGCLDINATNFDVEADNACGDCCNYPELQLDFEHKAVINDSTIINLSYDDQFYEDGAGNSFRIKKIQYYLSDFHLIKSNGDTLQVADTTSIVDASGQKMIIKDNFLLVNPGVFGVNSLGLFNVSDRNFSGVGFSFGLNDIANQADTTDFQEDHPLGGSENELFLSKDEGYAFAKIDLLPVADNDSLVTEIIIQGNDQLIPIRLEKEFVVLEGVNPRVILFVDYLSWFKTVDIALDTKETLQTKIVAQLANSFQSVEIEDR